RERLPNQGIVYVGNHGLDRHDGVLTRRHPLAKQYLAAMAEAVADLRQELDLPGLLFEEKGVTVSIHYRRCPDSGAAREEILQAIERSDQARGLQVLEGRRVVELRPPIDVNKGSALLSLAKEYGLRGVICLELLAASNHAFRAVRLLRQKAGRRGVAIGVLSKETPADFRDECDFTLQGVVGVENFLERLVQLTGEGGKDGKLSPPRQEK
ncbi:MAG: trehalose-phosphatase, partial [Chloroflexi bacterium]|nr:trehalose-phosphatase [Chloroflexota bacterium]